MRRIGSFVMLAALSAALGCGGCDDEAGGNAGFDGAACEDSAECRGDCVDGVCEGGGTGADGERCESDDDCLGSCEGGVCADAPANSTPNNTTPNNGSNNTTPNSTSEVWDPNQAREEYCEGSGPPVVAGGAAGTQGICTGDIAQTTFRFALCVCEDYGSSGSLTTDSFDSSQDAYDPNAAGAGGAVGINGRYDSSGTANIGGSLWVGSTQGISSGGDVTVENELRTNGGLNSSKTISIARDAYIAGNVAVQDLSVGGSIFTPNGTNVDTQGQVDVVRQAVGEIEPCDCDEPLDISGIVALNQAYNHNADVGLDPDVFSSFNQDVTVELDCGRFFLSEIVGSGNVTLNLSGRTAIFIEGDLEIAGELTINVAADASVDVFIAGDLNLGAAYVIGDPARPASARFYSSGEIVSFSQEGVVAGNIYAPHANMTFSAPLVVYGSLFARRINFSDSLTVHYDEAILTASEDCDDPSATPSYGSGTGGDPCEDSLDCRGGICGASNTCEGDGSGGDGDTCVMDGDCIGPGTCGLDNMVCIGTGGYDPGAGYGSGTGGDDCTADADCAGGECAAGSTCVGDGGGLGGDTCTTDGDCSGSSTCGADNTCTSTGGGGGGDPGMCTDCTDCGNQACNDGVCGECSDSLDCCSPLICYQGQCILVIP